MGYRGPNVVFPENVYPEGPGDRPPERLRPFGGHRALRSPTLVGVVAGLVTAISSFAVLFVVGLLPSQFVWGLFGSGGHGVIGVARAALAPFNGGVYASWREGPAADLGPLTFSRATESSWGAAVLLFVILSLVGIAVRRRFPDSLRRRCLALLATSLTVAVVTALWAKLLHFNTAATGPPGGGSGYYSFATHFYFGPASYFVSALALTLLLGIFAFDIAALLRAPLASALRRAGALVGIAFLCLGLLFPVFVISDRLPTAHSGEGFMQAAAFSSAVGGFAIPLALQAPVSVTQNAHSPWVNPNSTSDRTFAHWRNLAMATTVEHPQGRLYQYAASLGIWGSLVGATISAVVLAALAFATIGLCRRLRVLGWRRCLGLGLLQGACVALLVGGAAVVTTQSYRRGGQMWDLWRTTPLGLAYTAVILIAFCAAVGVVYAVIQGRRVSTSTRETKAGETASPVQPR